MKVKLKEGWELDCLVLRKNGEKITFKYDELTNSLLKIIEVKEEELKELFDIKKISPICESKPMKDSSDKSSGCDNPFRPVNPKIIHIMPKNKPKISLETIKKIKIMSEAGKDNKAIAEYFHISPQLVNYWRKNTPKGLT